MDVAGKTVTRVVRDRSTRLPTTADRDWYALQTKQHCEAAVQCRLRSDGIATYLPVVLPWPRPAVGAELVPLFPGYVFVHLAKSDHHRVNWVPGAKQLVSFEPGVPSTLPDAAIDFLKSKEDARGVVQCESAVAGDGATLEIGRGPLAGFAGVVSRRLAARDRVVLLTQLFQRDVSVELPDRWLRPV